MRARKKPIVVDCWVINQDTGAQEYPRWVLERLYLQTLHWQNDGLHIKTKEGVMLGRPGAILVKGHAGEVWAIQKDIFDDTYEILDAEDPSQRCA